ncbi:MAG: oligosaccharide flippase family protein [Deferribacteraceae bacterium]|jgi:O-antigen/teichoic acid export membrane protein|nr:oligosaccharide flippase family protein [Deferribacteraceae bacterium]
MPINQEQEIKSRSSSSRVLYILKDTVLYGILLALSKISLLIVLPILTHYLSNSHYGVLDTLMMLGIVFVAISTLGQDEAIGRFYYDSGDDARKQIITSSLLLVAFVSTTLVATCYLLADPILTAVLGGTEFKREFFVLLGYIPLISMLQVMRSISRWTFRKRTFFILNIGQTVTLLTLTLLFVGIMGLDIRGAVFAQIIASGAFLLVGIYLLRDLFTLKISSNITISLVKFGAPLMLAFALSNYANVMDKSLYNSIFGGNTLGTYTFAARYASFASIPIFAIYYAWMPVLYSVYKEENGQETFQKTIYTVAGVLAVLLFMQMAISEVATSILTPAGYVGSTQLIFPIAVGIYIGAVGEVVGVGIELARKTYYKTIITLIALFTLYIVANLAKYTGSGVTIACGVLACMCVSCSLKHLASYKLAPFRYKTFKIYAIIALSAALCAIFLNIQPKNMSVQIPLRISLFIILLIVVWNTMLDKGDRRKLLNKISRKAV